MDGQLVRRLFVTLATKHFPSPSPHKCSSGLCLYKSGGEYYCKQHMEQSDGWTRLSYECLTYYSKDRSRTGDSRNKSSSRSWKSHSISGSSASSIAFSSMSDASLKGFSSIAALWAALPVLQWTQSRMWVHVGDVKFSRSWRVWIQALFDQCKLLGEPRQVTLRVITVVLAVLTGPLIPLLKGRLPPTEQSALQRTDWTCQKKPLFWVYRTSNLA